MNVASTSRACKTRVHVVVETQVRATADGTLERSMLGVQCEPEQGQSLSERESLLLHLGQALPPATPPELASAPAAMIADRCFEEGLDLMLAGLAISPDMTEQTTARPVPASPPGTRRARFLNGNPASS